MSIVLNLDRDTLVKLPVTEKTTDLEGQALPAPPAWSAALFPHSGVCGGGPHTLPLGVWKGVLSAMTLTWTQGIPPGPA